MCEQRSSVAQRSYWPLIWGGILLVLIALGGITLGLWQASRPRSGGERPLEQLGNFGTVPEFALTERSERHVTRNELLGLVWVANFLCQLPRHLSLAECQDGPSATRLCRRP
jgi:hypothetical protein